MKNTRTQQRKIDELLATLSSAYQESAIESAIEYFNECQANGEELDQQGFMDTATENYRDTLDGLVGYDIKDIYDGFRKFGDECDVDFIASKVWQVLVLGMTSKEHHNDITRKAWKINAKLDQLRKECEALIEQCQEHGDRYDSADYEYQLALLEETLGALSNFDLEDSIPEDATVEY